MSSGDQSPLVMPEVCDQGISTNIAPPDLSEATAGPVNIMPDNYSPGSHPSLLNDECMPEFMDFHDDLFISGFSSSETSSSGNPDANESDFNPSYEPDARFLVNSSIFESDGHGCDVLGSPMDLVSPVPAPPGTSHSSISPELVPVNEEENCDCTGTALRMLELIATPPTRDDWQATEKKLYFLKKVISQCVVLSQCSSCPEDSGLSMLLIVMFEKLQTLFEEVADWRRRNVDHHGVLDSRQSPPSREARSYSSQDRGSPYQKPAAKPRSNLSMGCYQIDTPEEHLNIISTLVLLQLRRLAALVSKMRRNATKCRWDAHLNVLKSLTQRMKRLSATLQICHNLRGSDGRAKFMFC
ncbi:hypothetical protein QQS21_000405 [Conoideocrella luteorostrata]|uniref:Uncharacterized protein n=1 Tax=Conoideocrella luteorostrata TaxID=1105319 RepID=A0AAJ0G2I6_9HYPO|nr:hypothetical protein QQS21_000405 [Conoideocrella luteorostrata]